MKFEMNSGSTWLSIWGSETHSVVVFDETDFIKRRKALTQLGLNTNSILLYRRPGRIENCQVGVFLTYSAADKSRCLIDRELYLPRE